MFSSEIAEDGEITVVCCIGAKNYSYLTRKKATKEPGKRVTKIRGLTLKGEACNQMDVNKMVQFVEKVQQNQKV